MLLSSSLPEESYKRVKYEDLVSDPVVTMLELFLHLGVPVSRAMIRYDMMIMMMVTMDHDQASPGALQRRDFDKKVQV